jgi:D-mannonate dehydratase
MSNTLDDFMSIDLDNTMNYSIVPSSSASTDTITIDTGSYNWNPINNWNITNPAVTVHNSTTSFDCDVKISESRDLHIGDRSLKEFMERVEERLNILRPNQELEGRWNELAELGKRYRELEAVILEKEKMWNILKDE